MNDAATPATEDGEFRVLDRRIIRVFAGVDAFCGLFLLTVFVGAVYFDVLPFRAMDFDDVEISRAASLAKAAQLYTLIPFSAALFAIGVIAVAGGRPRALALAAFTIVATALLLLCCTLLVPWGRNEGWGPYLLGNGLIAIGILAHAWLAVRLWRRTLTTAP